MHRIVQLPPNRSEKETFNVCFSLPMCGWPTSFPWNVHIYLTLFCSYVCFHSFTLLTIVLSLTYSFSFSPSCSAPHPNVLDIGFPKYECSFCDSFFWYRERCVKTSTKNNAHYNLWCREGRACLPLLQSPPELLKILLTPNGCSDSNHFWDLIRTYNSLLSMTSIGCRVDERINNVSAPYTFRISGEIYHRIGSLLPLPDCRPSFL